jgi:hypothetical protein
MTSIRVVNYAKNEDEKLSVVESYRNVFPDIALDNFDFRGAVEWARDFVLAIQA